ncbi:MAG: LysM peptidoglycan-binding domain-containing protein [Nocardioidaceae bacterium]|nr:LysM peptidoglycan-binding domain-containing protein [Nocardioidaceae bacterium]
MSTAVDFDTRLTRPPETRRRPVSPRRTQPRLECRRPPRRVASLASPEYAEVVVQRSLSDGAVAHPPALGVVSPHADARSLRSSPCPDARTRRVPPRADGPVRLTRRGRLLIFLTLVAVTCAAVASVAGPALSAGEAHHAPSRTVVVSSGETLWEIAQQIAPGEDPREVIDDIVDLNALNDAGSIRVGQQLQIPTY